MGSLAADERRARVAGMLPGLVDDLKRLVAIPSVSGFGFPGNRCSPPTTSSSTCCGRP
jgi:hypothetical protein